MRVLLGVSGGIAAYKAVLMLRQLREEGHRVRVIPTPAALEFVGSPTWAALSGEAVTTSVFEGIEHVDHVRLGREADLVVVAPATADLLARTAHGRADDLLTATLLTTTAPVLLAPAMHTEMWQHPATRENVATLRRRGVHVLDPDSGRLTGADSGPGRLPEPEHIVRHALSLLAKDSSGGASGTAPSSTGTSTASTDTAGTNSLDAPWAGRHVAVSAGGTREPLDPVRFLGNRSSGRQGVELARAAATLGAQVDLAAANIEAGLLADLPAQVTCHQVESTAELQETMTVLADSADVLIMAAAVADFRPTTTAPAKTKKNTDGAAWTIELVQNPDILAGLVAARHPGQVIIGFAAETGDAEGSVLDHGRRKAARKQADLLAVNEVGTSSGFGDVDNTVHLLTAAGTEVATISGTKQHVAERILDTAAGLLTDRAPEGERHQGDVGAGTLGP